jgi:hypothetical protein
MNKWIRIPLRIQFITYSIAILFLTAYLFAQGRQGISKSITSNGRYIYVAYGEFGHAYLYEIRNEIKLPEVISKISKKYPKINPFNNPFDKSSRLSAKEIEQIKGGFGDIEEVFIHHDTLYAVDAIRGIMVFNNKDMNKPEEIARLGFYDVRDITFYGNLTFIAAGRNGVYLLDLQDPLKPRIIDHYDTPGYAERVFPTIIEYSGDNNPENPNSYQTSSSRHIAFVADGDSGILILDFFSKNAELARLRGIKQYDTPGYTYDVFYNNFFLFVADGEAGVHAFSNFNTNDDPASLNLLGSYDTPGEARQVIYHNLRLFIADGKEGLISTLLVNRGKKVEFQDLRQIPFPGGTQQLAVSNDLVFVASGLFGTHSINYADPYQPKILHQILPPGLATSGQIQAWIQGNPKERNFALKSIQDSLKELIFAGILFFIWLLVLIPFTIPYSRTNNLWQLTLNFVNFILRRLDRTVIVQNGRILTDPASQNLNLIRPLLLDNASAGLVASKSGQLRIIGPGMALLNPGDSLERLEDIRPKSIIIGPNDENPFEKQQDSENVVQYQDRLNRRAETSADTGDGVEIVPNIVINYRINGTMDPIRNLYGFDPTSASQVLRRKTSTIYQNYSDHYQVAPDRLPADLTVNAWRTHLRFYTLERLFSPLAGQDFLYPGAVFGLQRVIENVNRSLTQPTVDELGSDGQPTGNQVISEAYHELTLAGFSVLRVWIVNLRIEPGKEAEFIRRWIQAWPERIVQAQEALDARLSEVVALNRQKQLLQFARASGQALSEGKDSYREMQRGFMSDPLKVSRLVHGTSSMQGLSEAEKFKLKQLLTWLERNLEL